MLIYLRFNLFYKGESGFSINGSRNIERNWILRDPLSFNVKIWFCSLRNDFHVFQTCMDINISSEFMEPIPPVFSYMCNKLPNKLSVIAEATHLRMVSNPRVGGSTGNSPALGGWSEATYAHWLWVNTILGFVTAVPYRADERANREKCAAYITWVVN